MKYSILMPYHDRLAQLRNTLAGFCQRYEGRDDFEVVLVVDNKSIGQMLELLSLAKRQPFPTQVLLLQNWDTLNPAPHYNFGVEKAIGEYLILTSPEVMHVSDILVGFDEELEIDPDAYVVCACKSINRNGSFHMWYQQSKYRDVRYHFCSVIHRPIWDLVGGFDEEYAYGVAYDDDDFVNTLMHRAVKIVVRDDLLTVHQWHERPQFRTPDRRRLVMRNRRYFEAKWKRGQKHA